MSRPLHIPFLLKKTRPTARYEVKNKSDYNSIVWKDKHQECPTLEELEAAFDHLQLHPEDNFVSQEEINAILIPRKKSFWEKLKGLFKGN